MNLKLIASAPCKRFDPTREMCLDGRGGWVFSQVNVDRHITTYEDYWLIFYFGVLVESAVKEDFVESTLLTARMNGQKIGSNELEWRRPNPMWSWVDGDAIFEFSQPIMMHPEKDGLIIFDLNVKLNSQTDWLPVEGNAYVRIRLADKKTLPDCWVSPTKFWFRTLFSKSFWGGPNKYRG